MTTYTPALLADDGEPGDALDVLVEAGWRQSSDSAANCQMVAPDGRARLVFQPESIEYAHTDVLWKLEAIGRFEVPAGDGPHHIPIAPMKWTATFTGEVPVALIRALLDRMVTPVDAAAA
ncbi:DUF317 domain-containing protein [Streptomyces sp. NPDC093514]|uniref:DUF317 domain-containing protein n=1 Tax=Streptomyces sp. NPDC093514 TaxID=3366039 RepID=UPI00381F7413